MKKSKLQTAAILSYVTVGVVFILLFVYMGTTENVSVRKTRQSRTYHMITDYSVTEIEDPSAPIGIRKEYSWVMENITTSDTTLAFYLVHNYAEVYFDDELMYSLMPRETNRIGKSISSNWVTIPVYPTDSGKLIHVLITPVYESVRDREIEFQLGSLHRLYSTQLTKDLTQILLSSACLVFGSLIMVMQLIFLYFRKTRSWDLFYLGNFLQVLGIWKITDTRFSPWMFSGNTMVLGYLCIGALFFSCIPFTLYLKECFSERNSIPLLLVSVAASGITLTALLFQVFGIADLKEILPMAHILIGTIVVIIIFALVEEKRQGKREIQKGGLSRILILAFGVLADVFVFYMNGSSSGLMFTLLAAIAYALSLVITSILDINQKAYRDVHTGLYNKNRWNDLVNMSDFQGKAVGMMMFDINGLKVINDTMGHEAGDEIILAFSDILRSVILPPNAICRWGGDEFAVMLTDVTPKAVAEYLKKIRIKVDEYNALNQAPALHYAVGYALSSEFPDMTRKSLLKKADERMYLNKQQWYKEHSLGL